MATARRRPNAYGALDINSSATPRSAEGKRSRDTRSASGDAAGTPRHAGGRLPGSTWSTSSPLSSSLRSDRIMLAVRGPLFFPGLLIWTIQSCSSFLLPTGTVLQPHHQNSTDSLGASMDFPSVSVSKSRRKRYISSLDMAALLEYHNRVRSQVFPPAANMEYMVWDERLAKSAEAWASQCIWDHGPSQLMKFVGQNLAIYSGRYRSITELVKSWHDERHYYSYPYPQECTPSCPNKCSGSVCSHYTQGAGTHLAAYGERQNNRVPGKAQGVIIPLLPLKGGRRGPKLMVQAAERVLGPGPGESSLASPFSAESSGQGP
ncbi:CRSPL inhibitor, partial [Polypterus senegalus]